MQPQPVSDVNPVWSPNEVLSRMANDSAEAALGSVDLGINSNSVRYVIHMRDSKSSKNSGGQLLSRLGSSYASDESKLLEIERGGVSRTCEVLALAAGIDVVVDGIVFVASAAASSPAFSAGGVLEVKGEGVPDVFAPSVYERPRHQTGSLELRSFIGSTSQIFWKMRRPTRVTSAPAAIATSIALAS